jgi:hypothetical protein
VGLVSRPHHLKTVFVNLYKYKRQCFATKNCLFSLRQKEFYELARQVGLVSCPHHLVDTFWLSIFISSVVDPGCLSRIQIVSIPHPGSASKNLSILTQKIVSKLSEI